MLRRSNVAPGLHILMQVQNEDFTGNLLLGSFSIYNICNTFRSYLNDNLNYD